VRWASAWTCRSPHRVSSSQDSANLLLPATGLFGRAQESRASPAGRTTHARRRAKRRQRARSKILNVPFTPLALRSTLDAWRCSCRARPHDATKILEIEG
jgi:hypothetical protein